MITNNITKKTLVERLIKENKINIDEALILLEQDITYLSNPVTLPITLTPYSNPFPGSSITVDTVTVKEMGLFLHQL